MQLPRFKRCRELVITTVLSPSGSHPGSLLLPLPLQGPLGAVWRPLCLPGEGGGAWQGGVRPGRLPHIPQCAGRPASKNGLVPSVHSAEAETQLSAYSSAKY